MKGCSDIISFLCPLTQYPYSIPQISWICLLKLTYTSYGIVLIKLFYYFRYEDVGGSQAICVDKILRHDCNKCHDDFFNLNCFKLVVTNVIINFSFYQFIASSRDASCLAYSFVVDGDNQWTFEVEFSQSSFLIVYNHPS